MLRKLGAVLIYLNILATPEPLGALNDVTDQLKVATYNLGLLEIFGQDLVPHVKARAGIAAEILSNFVTNENPQILLLQEVWTDSQAEPIIQEFSALGYSALRPSNTSLLGLTSGLLLFIKEPFKVEDWHFSTFRKSTFLEGFVPKGILTAKITNQNTGFSFIFLGTHTLAIDTNLGIPKDYSQFEILKDQMNQIVELGIAQSQENLYGVILAGDFNAGPGYLQEAYEILLTNQFFTPVEQLLDLKTRYAITWDQKNPLVSQGRFPLEPSACIDHIFVSGSPKNGLIPVLSKVFGKEGIDAILLEENSSQKNAPFPLSDHYGYLVSFTLASTPSYKNDKSKNISGVER